MTLHRLVLAVLALVVLGAAIRAQPTRGPVDPDVLALREAAWRAWFAGDEAALKPMLPPEFIGLSWGGGEWDDVTRTIAGSKEFKGSGGKLTRLAFPETRAQRYGDVVILYSRFEVAIADPGGKEQTTKGRATEVFVKKNGKWMHPGWHLDAVQ
jgi:Domain of unknown function (DUF4440)